MAELEIKSDHLMQTRGSVDCSVLYISVKYELPYGKFFGEQQG